MKTVIQIDKQGFTGQSLRTLSEARGIRERGYRVILACQRESVLEKDARENSLEVLPLDMRKFFPSLIGLLRCIKREKVDLISSHGYRDHILSVVAGRMTGIKVVRTKHNHKALKAGPFSRFIYGRLTDRIIAVSNYTKDTMVKSGLPVEHVAAIHTGVNLKHLSPQPKNHELLKSFNVPQDCPVIGTVARLSDRKGMHFLLDAVKTLADEGRHFICFIVGGGGSSSQHKIDILQQRAETLGISQYLAFTGWREDAAHILSLFDIFILPSLAEALGRSLVEAMALGKPVVASRVGGIPEAVDDGKTGMLVPPQDAPALAKALAFMLDNPEKTEEMGREGRKRAEELFDEEGMNNKICSIYEELLNQLPARHDYTDLKILIK